MVSMFCLIQLNVYPLSLSGPDPASRLNVALLIGAMATLLLWVVGLIAKQKNIHFSFQANTIKHRNVLSVLSIGWQALKRERISLKHSNVQLAILEIRACAAA